jgi:hypothetical protein
METADWEPDGRNVTVLPGVEISHLYFLYSGLTGWNQQTGSLTAVQ